MVRCGSPVSRPIARHLRFSASIVIGVVSLLRIAAPAEAAAWVRMEIEPDQPSAGEAVVIRVQIVDTQGADCLDDPEARVVPNPSAYSGLSGPDLDTMELHIHGPHTDNAPVSLTLTRRDDDPSIWEGTFVFPSPGRWSLQMAYPSWSSGIAGVPGAPAWVTDTCTGAERIVVVGPVAPTTHASCLAPTTPVAPRRGITANGEV